MKPAWALPALLLATAPAEPRPLTMLHHSFGAIVEGIALLVVLVISVYAACELFGAVRDRLWRREK